MKFSAEQIAGIVNGSILGDPKVEVSALAKIEEGKKGDISFLSNPKYEEFLYSTGASICIVNNSFEPAGQLPETLTLIKVEDAYSCFAQLLQVYNQMTKPQPEIQQPSFVHGTAAIGNEFYLGAFSCIGKNASIGNNVIIYSNVNIGENVRVGDGTIIYPGATIYRDCVIGSNCVLHAGCVIGADGFGFAPDQNGIFQKIPQIGNVILEDNVDVGANTTVDRATMGSTLIKKGSKLDNLVQIGHNVEVGQNTAMAAQAGVAGSCKIGDNVLIGGQVGLAGHLKVGDRVKIAAQSGVGGDVIDDDIVMGSPAFNNKEYKKSYIGFRKLPQMAERIKELENQIKELTKQNN